jgi:HK97 family phage prohead protease
MLARSIPQESHQTLSLAGDEHGLKAGITLADNDIANRVYTLVERGDLRGMSFAFRTIGESEDWWSETEDGWPLRELRKGRLFDVSVVVDPAYLDTEVQARSAAKALSMGANLPLRELIPAFERRSLLSAVTELRKAQQMDSSQQEDIRAEGSTDEGQPVTVGAHHRELMAARLRLCGSGFYPSMSKETNA